MIRSMRWTALPLTTRLRSALARLGPLAALRPKELPHVARRSWTLAPGGEATTPPAYFLPGQLDRVIDWVFADEHPRREMTGGLTVHHGPTRAHLIEDAWLVDGVLYKGPASTALDARAHRLPRVRVRAEVDRGAFYCSAAGNRWFGMWLMDDCPLYPLARDEGTPITTALRPGPHARQYEDWLGMTPTRLRRAFVRRAFLFEDTGQNRDKHRRFRTMSDALRRHVDAAPHPGVFILRGRAGDRRVLVNELEIAQRLEARRGLRIIDPLEADVPTIVRTCAGARLVIGVEGSALIHGILCLEPGASVVALQPPRRFCGLYKHLTDRDGQHFGFVVGHPVGPDFRVDPDEVERTLDLLPNQ